MLASRFRLLLPVLPEGLLLSLSRSFAPNLSLRRAEVIVCHSVLVFFCIFSIAISAEAGICAILAAPVDWSFVAAATSLSSRFLLATAKGINNHGTLGARSTNDCS